MSFVTSSERGVLRRVSVLILGASVLGCNAKPKETPPPTPAAPKATLGTPYRTLSDSPETTAAYVKSLQTPVVGKGIFVFSPVVGSGVAPGFSTACARWLFLAVGGAPEFSRTPLWSMGDQLQRDLERADLRLTPSEAKKAARTLATSHFVTGEATKDRIAFQVYDASGAKVGAAIVLSGGDEKMKAALPDAANALRAALGLPKAVVAPPTESAAELAFLGNLPMMPWTNVPEKDVQPLRDLATRSLMGSLQYWFTDPLLESAPANGTVRNGQLTALGGENPLILAELGKAPSAANDGTIRRLIGDPPVNLALAVAVTGFEPIPDFAVLEAEKAVRLSPENADTWVLLSRALITCSQQIRKSRTANRIGEGEWKKLRGLYAHARATAARACELAPASEKAAQALALSATFADDEKAARAAMDRAFALAKRRGINVATARWALQMYDPKWGGSPEDLEKIATRVAGLPPVSLRDAADTMDLLAPDFPAQATQLAKAIEAEALRRQSRGADSIADATLPRALLLQGKFDAALVAMKKSVERRPTDLSTQEALIAAYERGKRIDDAVAQGRKAFAANPKEARIARMLAELLARHGRYQEAVAPGIAAAKLAPLDVRALTAAGYPLMELKRYAEALPFVEKAAQYASEDPICLFNYGEVLCRLNRVKNGRNYLERVLRRTNDEEVRQETTKLLAEFPAPK